MIDPSATLTFFSVFCLTAFLVFPHSCTALPHPNLRSVLHHRSAGGPTPRPPYGTTILNSTQLPSILSHKTTETSDTRSIETIRNKLSLYAFAVDGKYFSVLDQIFAHNAIADYPAPLGLLNGLDTITTSLSSSQDGVGASQHILGSQFFQIVDQRDAFSVTYFQAIQSGTEDGSSETNTTYGQFQDTWYRANPRKQEWRIIRRNLVYMGN